MSCTQYRDLPADTHLSLSVYELSEGRPLLLVGSSSMPMFSKKGRLKTGQQRLQVMFEEVGLCVQDAHDVQPKGSLMLSCATLEVPRDLDCFASRHALLCAHVSCGACG
jgi:hypothetical protein